MIPATMENRGMARYRLCWVSQERMAGVAVWADSTWQPTQTHFLGRLCRDCLDSDSLLP